MNFYFYLLFCEYYYHAQGSVVWNQYTWKIKHNSEVSDDISKDKSEAGKGIILDWWFNMKISQDKDKTEILIGVNRKQSYLLISDHHISKLWQVYSGINTHLRVD